MRKFAENLNGLMFDKNINQKELAEKLNIDYASICRYLKGECEPTVKNLIKLADFFKCTVDYLIGIDSDSIVTEFLPAPPINERIKFIVEKENLTGYKFCQELEFNQSTYSKWINGKRTPSINYIIKIADRFNLSVDYVLGREK